jgi:hypothetical protein
LNGYSSFRKANPLSEKIELGVRTVIVRQFKGSANSKALFVARRPAFDVAMRHGQPADKCSVGVTTASHCGHPAIMTHAEALCEKELPELITDRGHEYANRLSTAPTVQIGLKNPASAARPEMC